MLSRYHRNVTEIHHCGKSSGIRSEALAEALAVVLLWVQLHPLLLLLLSLLLLYYLLLLDPLVRQEWLGGFQDGGGAEGEMVDSFDRVSCIVRA